MTHEDQQIDRKSLRAIVCRTSGVPNGGGLVEVIVERSPMEQNEKLRAARDLLLPRLMSGEITV